MSNRRFLMWLGLIVALGTTYRCWPRSIPDLSVEEYVRQGQELFARGNVTTAVQYQTAALGKEPDNVAALANRGGAYLATQQFDLALGDLNRAVEVSRGGDRKSILLRAHTYEQKGELDKALADANQAIAMDPKGADGYLVRALIYKNPGRPDLTKARTDYEKAITLNPKLLGPTRILGF